jgi:NADH dehydrogenase
VRLQPVHVDDVAAAARALVSGDEGSDTVLELGGADVLSYREVVQSVMDAAGRRRPLVPVPLGLWHVAARGSALLPSPPLTPDQVVLMSSDNVARPPGFDALGIEPRGFRAALPECLGHGR